MTLNDLKEEISALGFEKETELDKSLLFAIKRALNTVYSERAVYNRIKLEHYPIMPTLVCKNLTHKVGDTESFVIKGRAYSFTVSGSGSYSIEENGQIKEERFSSLRYLCRGFINGEATLRFYGNFSFEVFSIAVFDTLRSESEEDIFPYGEAFEYEILKIKKDFHSFTSLPTNEFEKEITGALLSGSKMLIPWGYRGQINLTYKAAAPEVSIDKADEEIPVPKETEHLIALLSAAYYWVDDSPDKAEYYLSLYKDALRFLKQCNTRAVGGGYRNVTGWA